MRAKSAQGEFKVPAGFVHRTNPKGTDLPWHWFPFIPPLLKLHTQKGEADMWNNSGFVSRLCLPKWT